MVGRPHRQEHSVGADHAQLHVLHPLAPLLKDLLAGQFPDDLHKILRVVHDVAVDAHPLVVLELDHILVYGLAAAHRVSIVNYYRVRVGKNQVLKSGWWE